MRLKKADREKYLKQIRDSKNQKVVSIHQNDDLDFAWFELTWDHFSRLRLDLDHIGRIPLDDALQRDAICSTPTTKDFLQRYTDKDLLLIWQGLKDAEKSLAYLRNLIIEEDNRRGKMKSLLIKSQALF